QIGQRIAALVHRLDGAGIPVVVATGNGFAGQQGVGFPAILPETISVAALDASGHVAPDTQRLGAALGGAAATDLAAPGAGMLAPVQGQDFTTVSGSSFAAPLVSAAVLLLQQVYQARFAHLPSVPDLQPWLEQA